MTYKRTPRQTAIGPLGPGSKNAPHYLPDRETFATPERVTNAMQRAPLHLAALRASAKRPGSMTAFSLPSRGTGC
jgi:hypothetical protein